MKTDQYGVEIRCSTCINEEPCHMRVEGVNADTCNHWKAGCTSIIEALLGKIRGLEANQCKPDGCIAMKITKEGGNNEL